ncbi:Predicted Fe2+/Mn2+ transporter, VIT1/CCC1 family [Salinihabitans flavidus]|uniref:Predicted Fe2+/Mn2+ transporter, VIT1/CCC1 family n=1 Tax=Salinihabitans flavidus TaxID=569882 RepID=A0A1H8QJC6_9RHOB|nr:VIT family protein [Salinihabitans flavidus]SEO54027.1 Predicted Fe2+/Mn2+ transporter, VIT1/CCC1 family [Salinihabitans flavidus]
MPKDGHYINRSNWLRAAILGANDGIVSTASLLVGVEAVGMEARAVLLAGLAGLCAGAMSMAAAEYVSVSAQANVEEADLKRERQALIDDPDYELQELADGLERRGVESGLALIVARQMTIHDALDAHAREELGMSGSDGRSRPLQAAFASALSFTLGAAMPLAGAVLSPVGMLSVVVAVVALLALALLGGVGAWLGGAPVGRSILRVTLWGSAAMILTSALGGFFQTGP